MDKGPWRIIEQRAKAVADDVDETRSTPLPLAIRPLSSILVRGKIVRVRALGTGLHVVERGVPSPGQRGFPNAFAPRVRARRRRRRPGTR